MGKFKRRWFYLGIVSILLIIFLFTLIDPFNMLISQARVEDIRLRVYFTNNKDTYNLSDPIYVSLELTNIRNKPVKILKGSFEITSCHLEYSLINPDNVTYIYYGKSTLPTRLTRVIRSNETIKLIYNLKEINMISGIKEGKEEFLSWNLTGRYSIQFKYYLEWEDEYVISNLLVFYLQNNE